MRKVSLLLVLTLSVIELIAQVRVSGHYRSNGTYVQPHYRSSPDNSPSNNWSYPGNTNPYTGKTATGNPDTYSKNYNVETSNSSQTYSNNDDLSKTHMILESKSNYSYYHLVGRRVVVFQYSPIYKLPSVDSKISCNADDMIVTFVEDLSDEFFIVKYKNTQGYMPKKYLNISSASKNSEYWINYSKYSNLIGKKVIVFQYSPVYKLPSIESKIIANADDMLVILLEEVNDDFFLVSYNKVQGYMPKKYINH